MKNSQTIGKRFQQKNGDSSQRIQEGSLKSLMAGEANFAGSFCIRRFLPLITSSGALTAQTGVPLYS